MAGKKRRDQFLYVHCGWTECERRPLEPIALAVSVQDNDLPFEYWSVRPVANDVEKYEKALHAHDKDPSNKIIPPLQEW